MVSTRRVEYWVDGTMLVGRLFIPEGIEARPGVLLSPEASGLGEFELGRARRLAAQGYMTLAMDYYGDGAVFSDPDEMMSRLQELGSDPARMRSIGRAAHDALVSEPRTDSARLAAVGHCFGAAVVLEFARDGADLKAVVGFHPGESEHDPAETRQVRGKVLWCIGANDPFWPSDARHSLEEEFRRSDIDWQIQIYGGAGHSFTNPEADRSSLPGIAYSETADRRSWRAMLDLFDEVFA